MTWIRLAALFCCIFLGACSVVGSSKQAQRCVGEPEALGVMDAFMGTFNARDMAAWEATFQFPHVRMASGGVQLLAPGDQPDDLFQRLVATGWHHSAWIDRTVVQCGRGKIHFATTFARYRKDGSELARYQSLYVMEEVEGRWGVRARSSYAP